MRLPAFVKSVARKREESKHSQKASRYLLNPIVNDVVVVHDVRLIFQALLPAALGLSPSPASLGRSPRS
jgi:hypothetical protein